MWYIVGAILEGDGAFMASEIKKKRCGFGVLSWKHRRQTFEEGPSWKSRAPPPLSYDERQLPNKFIYIPFFYTLGLLMQCHVATHLEIKKSWHVAL